MKVFISGASGLIGSNCLRYFREKGWDVIGSHFSFSTEQTVYFNTLDWSDSNNFDLDGFAPNVIVHCGALTHVDYCETHEEESYNQTVQSTINLAQYAAETGALMILLSTDYVFDGKKGPYSEDAKPHPLNVYGRHKLRAEQLLRRITEKHLILRVTNVYGEELRKKNFVARIIQQVEEGKELQLKLPHDQYASPTNAWDIARAMYELVTHNKRGIYHIGGTDYMNRVSLALKILSYFPEAKYSLVPMSTEELQQAARRPLKGGFITEKFNREFPEFVFSTLSEYLTRYFSICNSR